MLETGPHKLRFNNYGTTHKLRHIVAVSADGVIGIDGDLPFRLKGDLPRFKRLTMGKPMVMGRKTFDSLPGVLPGRQHVILTRQDGLTYKGQHVALEDGVGVLDLGEGPGTELGPYTDRLVWANTMALGLYELRGYQEVYIIGGGEIYRQTALDIDTLRMTYVPRPLGVEELRAEGKEVTTYPLGDVRGMTCISEEPVFKADGSLSHVYLDAECRDEVDPRLPTLGEMMARWSAWSPTDGI